MEEVKKNPLSMQVSMDDFIPASADDKESLVIMRESVGFWKDGIRRFSKNKIAMSAFFLVLLIMIFCFIVNKAYSLREQINDGVIYSQSKKRNANQSRGS